MNFQHHKGAGSRLPERASRTVQRVWSTLLVAGSSVFAVTATAAQEDRVDAGSFSVFEKGVRVGREQFSVRRAPSPDGTAFELRAESVLGDRRAAVQQSVDSLGIPVHYSLEVREGTSVTVRAGGQRVRGRFVTQTRRSAGESAREYLLAPGVIILEPTFYHQLAVVLRRRTPGIGQPVEMTVLSLLDFSQQRLNLVLESRVDSAIVAGSSTPALRWRLEGAASPVQTIWTDSEGRLLKVVVAALFLEATRDELPR